MMHLISRQRQNVKEVSLFGRTGSLRGKQSHEPKSRELGEKACQETLFLVSLISQLIMNYESGPFNGTLLSGDKKNAE